MNYIRCGYCGKYISHKSINKSVKVEYTPDTELTNESTVFIHNKCLAPYDN